MKNKKFEIKGKSFSKPVTCLTAYSGSMAKILDGIVDIVLIGDSLGMTLYDMPNTQSVTIDMMSLHGSAVIKNINKSFTIIDMPYKSYENNLMAYKNAKKLIKITGADFVKLEVNERNVSVIKYLSQKKINTVAHIGVTPQSYKDFKKLKIAGKTKNESEKLVKLSKKLESFGTKIILLECIYSNTAKTIVSSTSLPCIGIGASKFCDGQVLVFDDLLNLNPDHKKPKFVKNYMNFSRLSKSAIKNYVNDVKLRKFPNKKFSY